MEVEKYVNVLDRDLLPTSERLFGEDRKLLQDNASGRTAQKTK